MFCFDCKKSSCTACYEANHYSVSKDPSTHSVPQKLELWPLGIGNCPKHFRIQELWCSDDNEFICYPCVLDNHKGHNVEQVEGYLKTYSARYQEKSSHLKSCLEEIKSHHRKTDHLISSIDSQYSETADQVGDVVELSAARETKPFMFSGSSSHGPSYCPDHGS